MPHALLLSPDDQAVNAITGVLEEMSVTCERPLDGASAAQKLNAQSFDLVLVDCENLPAAKLVFDVCRRGKNGNNPVPIAIVDGRAGLPTAFRLGAELILTKPVAKDQARSTIRTAVSRVRRDVEVRESVSAPAASAAIPSAVVIPERAQAAAAAMVSSSFLCLPPANFADPAPDLVATADAGAVPSAPLSRFSPHREDAVRVGRNRCRTRDAKVRTGGRLSFSIRFVRVRFGSDCFGRFHTHPAAFRRSGACGTGEDGTGTIGIRRITKGKLGTGKSGAGANGK